MKLELIWTLAFMAFIGALIGGFTNHLAIKMLFRPHEPKYIGTWRIPFTPGLIPKRRNELAKQLGKTVTNYLLTPDMLRKKFLTPAMEKKAEQFIQKKLEQHVLKSQNTLLNWTELAGVENTVDKMEQKISVLIDQQLLAVKVKLTTGTVEETVPVHWQTEIERRIPHIISYFIQRADQFVHSIEGKLVFKRMIDDFLASKGTFGNMVHMLFGESDTIVSKVQKEAGNFIAAPGTAKLLQSLLEKEWTKLQKKPLDELLGDFDWDRLFESIKAYTLKEIALRDRFDRTLESYWPSGSEFVEKYITPQIVTFLFMQAEQQLETTLQKLQLEEVVKEQVDSFPVAVLEDLVLGISKREFKMITVLGALLGGIIGIVQGILVFVLNL